MLASFEPRVGDTDDPLVGLDRAEWIIRSLGSLRSGQRIEQSAFTDIRQTDDPAIKAHLMVPLSNSSSLKLTKSSRPQSGSMHANHYHINGYGF
jgi:hypothetical protein